VIVLMYMEAPVPAEAPGADLARPAPVPGTEVILGVAAIVTVFFGLYPRPLLDFFEGIF
jgi:NADH:ubiquinone oxidoreductase subunit 2 (subunit N)